MPIYIILDSNVLGFFDEFVTEFADKFSSGEFVMYTIDNIRTQFKKPATGKRPEKDSREVDHIKKIKLLNSTRYKCEIIPISKIKNFESMKKNTSIEFNKIRSNQIDDEWYYFKLKNYKSVNFGRHFILTNDKGISKLRIRHGGFETSASIDLAKKKNIWVTHTLSLLP